MKQIAIYVKGGTGEIHYHATSDCGPFDHRQQNFACETRPENRLHQNAT